MNQKLFEELSGEPTSVLGEWSEEEAIEYLVNMGAWCNHCDQPTGGCYYCKQD